MKKKKQKTKYKDYLTFLKKRLESKNFKARASEEEYQKTLDKYKKEKLRNKFK